jgi:hypothetical protein
MDNLVFGCPHRYDMPAFKRAAWAGHSNVPPAFATLLLGKASRMQVALLQGELGDTQAPPLKNRYFSRRRSRLVRPLGPSARFSDLRCGQPSSHLSALMHMHTQFWPTSSRLSALMHMHTQSQPHPIWMVSIGGWLMSLSKAFSTGIVNLSATTNAASICLGSGVQPLKREWLAALHNTVRS